MQNGPKTVMSTRQPKPAGSFSARPKRWIPTAARTQSNGHQNAQRSYERYLALAQEGSAVGECRRRGELLPTRRALLQIDVFEPRGDIDRDVPSRLTFAADALGCCPSPKPRANRAAHALMPPFRLMNWPRAPESGLYAAVYRRARLHRSRSRHRNHLLFGWPLCKFRNRERMRSM
jgi:hypothetical protein